MRQLSPGQANLISSEPNKSLAAMASSPSLLRVSTPFYRGFLTKMDIGYIHIVDLKTFVHMGTHPFLTYIIIHSTSFHRKYVFHPLHNHPLRRQPVQQTSAACQQEDSLKAVQLCCNLLRGFTFSAPTQYLGISRFHTYTYGIKPRLL